ncbi:MAG: hypothetical protein RIC14_00110 [Filomicrobium sp.]
MSGQERELELRRSLRDDFLAYAPTCLMIRTKAGALVPFTLNKAQQHVHERLEQQRKEKGYVRALILKGRQMGISTYVSGRFYWRISHTFGFRAFILTHLDTASANLFDIAKTYHNNCPKLVQPATGSANAKELSFPALNSGYKVATAGSAEVGRSETIQMFHASEVGFWPHADRHAAGIEQAIAEAEGTEDIRESTANGIGNAWHSMWQRAERGESEFIAIFLPWFWHDEYRKTPPEDWKPEGAWAEYQSLYDLDVEQVYWAFVKNRQLAAVAGGSPDEPCPKFKQEYPATAAEAFQTSGDSFIEPEDVMRARKNITAGYGPVVLGVDPARGGGDQTGLIDRQGRKLGSHICKLINSGDLMATAAEVQRIAKEINAAKVVIDTTGLGAGLYDRLRELIGSTVEAVNFGEKAFEPDRYRNRRAEMWDKMREWLGDKAGVDIPDDDSLHKDLCAPTRGPGATHFDSSSRLVLEPKDKIKERLGSSPDLGDASALTFAIELSDEMESSDWDSYASGGNWLGA